MNRGKKTAFLRDENPEQEFGEAVIFSSYFTSMKKVGPAFSDYLIQDVSIRKKTFARSPFSRKSIRHFPILLMVFLFSLLLIRSFYLQVIRGSYYRRLSDENRIRTKILPAERGIIFGKDGIPLVRNVPAYIRVDKDGKLKEWLEKDEALALLTREDRNVRVVVVREYLFKEKMSHVVGYIGQITPDQLLMSKYKNYSQADFIGKMGLEQQYEDQLRGIDGKELYEVDVNGNYVQSLGRQESIPGNNIITTLDPQIQEEVTKAFSYVKKGAAVVSNPSNGAILALYSKPSFDTNIFTHPKNYSASGDYRSIETLLSDNDNQPFLNRAVGGVYPPGSTFKLIVAAKALDSKKIDKDTKIEDTGVIKVNEFSYANWYFTNYGRKEGEVDVVKAIKRSNDIFFYKIAEELGPDSIAKATREFGIGEKLGIDLSLENKGVVPDPQWKKDYINEQWYLGDTYNYGIGQGYLLTTPLQVNFLTSVFANGGRLYRPHIIDGRMELLKNNLVSPDTIELIKQGMKQSCESGGVVWPFFEFGVNNLEFRIDGKNFLDGVASNGAKMVRIPVGCKTGTAETTKDEKPHAWITLFAPFYNPEVIITVLVENGGEGSSVAAPIAKQILEKYFETR